MNNLPKKGRLKMRERGRGNGKNLSMDGRKFTVHKFKEQERNRVNMKKRVFASNKKGREWEWTISSDSFHVCLHQLHPIRSTQGWRGLCP